jgi:hypothetical protein
MSKQNQIKQECNGCEFNCQLGAQWKVGTFFPPKYYPTINSSKIGTYTEFKGKTLSAITTSKKSAIMRAIIHTWSCVKHKEH